MKRFLTLIVAVLVMVAMLAINVLPAFADNASQNNKSNKDSDADSQMVQCMTKGEVVIIVSIASCNAIGGINIGSVAL